MEGFETTDGEPSVSDPVETTDDDDGRPPVVEDPAQPDGIETIDADDGDDSDDGIDGDGAGAGQECASGLDPEPCPPADDDGDDGCPADGVIDSDHACEPDGVEPDDFELDPAPEPTSEIPTVAGATEIVDLTDIPLSAAWFQGMVQLSSEVTPAIVPTTSNASVTYTVTLTNSSATEAQVNWNDSVALLPPGLVFESVNLTGATVGPNGEQEKPYCRVIRSSTNPPVFMYASDFSPTGGNFVIEPGDYMYCMTPGLAAGASATWVVNMVTPSSLLPGCSDTITLPLTVGVVPQENPNLAKIIDGGLTNPPTCGSGNYNADYFACFLNIADSITTPTATAEPYCLSLAKTSSTGTDLPTTPNTPITYTLASSNSGPGTATAPLVFDELPVGLVYNGSSLSGCTLIDPTGAAIAPPATVATGDILECVLPAISSGGTVPFTVQMSTPADWTATDANGNQVTVTNTAGLVGRWNPAITGCQAGATNYAMWFECIVSQADSQSTVVLSVPPPPPPPPVDNPPPANIVTTNRPHQPSAPAGSKVTGTVTVANRGEGAATNLHVTGLSNPVKGLKITGARVTSSSGATDMGCDMTGQPHCWADQLEPGGHMRIHVEGVLADGLRACTVVAHTATARAENDVFTVWENTGTARITIATCTRRALMDTGASPSSSYLMVAIITTTTGLATAARSRRKSSCC